MPQCELLIFIIIIIIIIYFLYYLLLFSYIKLTIIINISFLKKKLYIFYKTII